MEEKKVCDAELNDVAGGLAEELRGELAKNERLRSLAEVLSLASDNEEILSKLAEAGVNTEKYRLACENGLELKSLLRQQRI